MHKNKIIPDPINPEYGVDQDGDLWRKMLLDHKGEQIDIGYSPVEKE